MGAHKTNGFFLFLLEESIFAKLRIQVNLLVASDAIHRTGVLIENFIVAGPKFVREVRA